MFAKILVCVLTALLGTALTAHVRALPAATTRTVYISATTASGAQVPDLTTADIAVKEGGTAREVISLKKATALMDVHIFVDDNGTGAYQQGLLDFLQPLLRHARFSLSYFAPAAVRILNGSTSFTSIEAALNDMGRRGKTDSGGEQVVEVLGTTARALQKSRPARPVILVLTIGGDTGHRNPDLILDHVRQSGANVNVVYLQAAGIGLVLGDSPRESGGLSIRIGSTNAISPATKKIADSLLNQYQLTYALPDGVKPSDRVSITTTRSDVTLRGPSRIPSR